jgi:hypothetical protein
MLRDRSRHFRATGTRRNPDAMHFQPFRFFAFAAACLVLAVPLLGCTGAAAYERGKLAHPTMSTSDLAGPGEQHVRAVQEGAIGGGIGVGGGCGCN